MVSYISRTHDFEPKISVKKCGLYVSFYGTFDDCMCKNLWTLINIATVPFLCVVSLNGSHVQSD